jgi:transposase
LDAHKKEHKVALLPPGSDVMEEWVVKNQVREIKRMVKRLRRRFSGPIIFCYEAGVCGFALQRQIISAADKVQCQVIAPSLVPVKPGERVKTDRRDARKLVQLFRAGLLTEVHPPDEEEEAVRDLCRCRQAAQEDLGRIRQQLLKFLLRRAFIYHEGSHWTEKHLRWLGGLKFEQVVDQEIFTSYLTEMDHRRDRVKVLDQSLAEVAQQEPYKEPVGRLRCFRGIDTVTALTIVAELHGFERFTSPRQLMSYLGLTPSEHSSGDQQRQGGITKAGNSRVRRLLTEASWHQRHRPTVSKALRQRRAGQPPWVIAIADRAQQRLHRRYLRLLHKGKPPGKAVIAVARELAGFIWSVLYPGVQEKAGEDAA